MSLEIKFPDYLQRRFAEMLRQQYLNDPEFKYEHYPYEFKVNWICHHPAWLSSE